MAQLTARTSTIFIATGEETRVYRSVDDVPAALRRKLIASTRGVNSATILIADKRGREELVRALEGRSSDVQCRLVENIRSRQPEQPAPKREVAKSKTVEASWIWVDFLLPLAVGATLWAILGFRLF